MFTLLTSITPPNRSASFFTKANPKPASRLRAGQGLKFEFQECCLHSLVQDVVEDLSFTYGERFVVVSTSDIKSYFSCKEIRRVIENLAINAVKYGAPNTPITLTLEQTETHISLTIHS